MPRLPKKHRTQRGAIRAVTAASLHHPTSHRQSEDAHRPALPPSPRPPVSTSSLPAELSDLIENALKLSLAKSTRKNYESALRRLEMFCDTYQIPRDQRFPTDKRILCAFAGSHVRNSAGGTAANRISALKTLHALMNLPWKGGIRLSYVIHQQN
ncbi:hypothetical protein FRC12_006275 [Ceratobasidium sp. 428]|nr:hypothetical protein FRC12_006275 [Ceratobasidium sp. 428]